MPDIERAFSVSEAQAILYKAMCATAIPLQDPESEGFLALVEANKYLRDEWHIAVGRCPKCTNTECTCQWRDDDGA